MELTVKVSVTAQDIKTGLRDNCEECAVALAIKRLFPDSEVQVTASFAHVDKQEFVLPPIARVFIDQFDRYLAMKPIEFEMRTLGPALDAWRRQHHMCETRQ